MLCYGYEDDLNQLYAFYCARYENITYDEFLSLGTEEFNKKLVSIPESEPLYKIIKSRLINLGTIKNKDERKYWSQLRFANKIPQIYLSDQEINNMLKEGIGNGKRIS